MVEEKFKSNEWHAPESHAVFWQNSKAIPPNLPSCGKKASRRITEQTRSRFLKFLFVKDFVFFADFAKRKFVFRQNFRQNLRTFESHQHSRLR